MNVGLAVLLLGLIMLIGFGLNRGVNVGTRLSQEQATGGIYWYRYCSYLFPSGRHEIRKGGWYSEDEAANEFCPFLYQ